MDIHRCKLCSRRFLNGRSLGGHMKSHLSFLPHPPTTTIAALSSTASDDVPVIYALRENPRKTIKYSYPDFESEAESRDQGGSSRRRKRRSRKIGRDDTDSPDAEPVSSVSNASPEEDVAMCLMMLCRDVGWRNSAKKVKKNGADSNAQKKVHQCEICKKCFQSSQALGGHKIIHRKKVVYVPKEKIVSTSDKHESFGINLGLNRRIFECPFCGKVFGSGQALGGHKRSHLMGSRGKFSSSAGFIIDNGQNPTSAKNTDTTTTTTTTITNNNNNNSYIDLNLPAPTEDEDFYSVISDDDTN